MSAEPRVFGLYRCRLFAPLAAYAKSVRQRDVDADRSDTMMRRAAGIYLTGPTIIIHPVVRTDAGAGISVPPVTRLRADAAPTEIGTALRNALDAGSAVIRHPEQDEWKPTGERFLRAAGFRSWRQLENQARYCFILADEGRITITPSANGGTRGPRKGFQPFGAPEITVEETVSDDIIGNAVLNALSLCR